MNPERVQTDEGRHYKVGNNTYPSVTTVLNQYEPKKKKIEAWKQSVDNPEQIRERAALLGTIVHHRALNPLAIRDLPLPEIDLSMVDDELKTDIETCLALWEQIDISPGASPHVEERVWSDGHGYAGTLDLMADGTVYDIKTSSSVYDSHKIQAAAYVEAAKERPNLPNPEEAAIIRINPKPEKEVVRLGESELKEYFETFRSLLDSIR